MTRRLLTDRGVREVITDRDATAALEERIAEHVWAFYTGQHAEAVAWLERLGCKVVRRDVNQHGAEYILDGLVGVRVGLVYPGGDPISVAVQFGFALGGGMWAAVYGGMMDAVKARWKADRQNKDQPVAFLACMLDGDPNLHVMQLEHGTQRPELQAGGLAARVQATTPCVAPRHTTVMPANHVTYAVKLKAMMLCEVCTVALPSGWPKYGRGSPGAQQLVVDWPAGHPARAQ
jgi:hypothetical protein